MQNPACFQIPQTKKNQSGRRAAPFPKQNNINMNGGWGGVEKEKSMACNLITMYQAQEYLMEMSF